MQLKALIKEFNELGAEFSKAYAAFKRTAKRNKHAAYKKKRIAETTEQWRLYNEKIKEIENKLTEPNDNFEADKKQYEATYRKYMEDLMKITDTAQATDDMDDDVKTVIAKQETRFESLKRVLADIEAKFTSEDKATTAYCSVRAKKINDIWERIEVEDEELALDAMELPQDYNDKYNQYEIQVETTLVMLEERQKEASVTNNSGGNTDGLKLNRITIAKFGGDYFKWISFKNIFTSMVIKNKSYPKSQKMSLLKSYVTGEAETLIQDLTISDENFDSAWERLLKRFDNNRVVIYELINKLMSQQVARGSAKDIKRLLDTTDQVVLALQNLGRPTEAWDDWIVVLITQRLGEETHKDWEKRVSNTKEIPTWLELKSFMEDQFRMLERLEHGVKKSSSEKPKQIKSYQSSITNKNCVICEEEHGLFKCSKWREATVQDRWELAKKHKLCFACLYVHKEQLSCDKKKPCKKCNRKHNTWLHETKKEVTSVHCTLAQVKQDVLLATAEIYVQDVNGVKIKLRALIDSGSQGSMITAQAANLLQLQQVRSDRSISGLGENSTGPAKKMVIQITPRFESVFQLNIECYILQKLTKTLPDNNINVTGWNHIKDLVWADPNFNKQGPIDALLGMDAIVEIMKAGLIRGRNGQPMAQDTQLGWIMSGKIDPQYPKKQLKCLVSTVDETVEDISKFWEMEELHPARQLTTDDAECEKIYVETDKRDSDGKYIVKIPFKADNLGPNRLGASKGQAMGRFLQLEKRLSNDKSLRIEYVKVMNEYIELGHMREVTDEKQTEKLYYIPHHAIIKPDRITTKVRVVFDASAKTTTGVSLNECMYTGAKQQSELMDLLIKWRQYKIVFKADIEKMYRQIKLDQADQRYHTIIWRDDPKAPIKEYQLTTATFGTAAAPFMATRTLNQLAIDNKEAFPLVEDTIQQDFYVDDLISDATLYLKQLKRRSS